MSLLRPLLTILLTFAATASATSFVDPYPVNDCSGGIGYGQTICPNQPGCCSLGAICCAGGCCPITAWCVNAGTPGEGCCPLSDKTNCGAVVPTYVRTDIPHGIFSPSLCPPVSLLKEVLTTLFVIIMGQTLPACDGRPKPSVQCVSADDDWYCPHGYVCGTVSGACYDFAADCTTPGTAAGGGASTATSPPSSGATSSSSSVPGSDGGSGTTGTSGGTTSPPKSAGAFANNVHTRLVVTLGALVVVGVVRFIM